MYRLVVTLIILLLSVNTTFAYNLNKMTDDGKILSALNVLERNGMTDVFTRIEKSKAKIMFYDLSMIDYSYAKHYAVASTDEYGDNYILINSNLRNSPKEALACLIAHESVHQLPQATYEEEVRATNTEARTWIAVKNTVSGNYENDRLVQRLNRLVAMQNNGNDLIAKAISNNAFYQNQLARN